MAKTTKKQIKEQVKTVETLIKAYKALKIINKQLASDLKFEIVNEGKYALILIENYCNKDLKLYNHVLEEIKPFYEDFDETSDLFTYECKISYCKGALNL